MLSVVQFYSQSTNAKLTAKKNRNCSNGINGHSFGEGTRLFNENKKELCMYTISTT